MRTASPDRDAAAIRIEIQANDDVVVVRQHARQLAMRAGFSLTETTKLVTAASELARNTLEHGGGGWALLELVTEGPRTGVRMVFDDEGPGIPDIEAALRDGFTTGGGLGLGLGGSKRLVSDLIITSTPGKGTRVAAVRWK